MKISNIIDLIDGKMICGETLSEKEIYCACGSDLMSDVLAHCGEASMLITGLVNPQVIRTAEMMDIHCIIFARSKQPGEDMIAMAKERGIALLTTDRTMFSVCGILYSNGIKGG